MSAPATLADRPYVISARFTSMICERLGLHHPLPLPDETESENLLRRLNALKWISRQWARTRLEDLPPVEFDLAGQQICNAAADFCQDLNAYDLELRRLRELRTRVA